DPIFVVVACTIVMVASGTYSEAIQVRYRFLRHRQLMPVSGMAVALFLIACGVFVLEAVHPDSTLPPETLSTATVLLVCTAVCLAAWSFVMNMRVNAIIRASELEARMRTWRG